MSGTTEITLGEQQTYEHNLKIHNFRRFTNTEQEFRSKPIEIFPCKKIAFLVRGFSDVSPDGDKIVQYGHSNCVYDRGSWTDITEDDRFFFLKLVVPKGFAPPRLAGTVEISVGDFSETIKIGDAQKEKYAKFETYNGTFLEIKPRKGCQIQWISGPQGKHYTSDSHLYHHVKLSADVEADDNILEIKFTLFHPGVITQNMVRPLPDTIKSSVYLSELTMKMMKDVSTTDMKITCGEKGKKKIFNVHKSFFCTSSSVIRAAVENNMRECRSIDISIEEVDEKTIQEMIHYVYTGKFTGADLNVQMVARLADKYDLPGMMDLLCFQMRDVEDKNIADMLIAAGNISGYEG